MTFRLNKKGMNQILLVFELFVAAAVIFVFIAFAKKVALSGEINEEFITKDVALMTDALHAVPGDAAISYDVGNATDSFEMYIFNGNSKTTGLSGLLHNYPYRESEDISLAENKMTVQKDASNLFSFEKTNSLISVKKIENQEAK